MTLMNYKPIQHGWGEEQIKYVNIHNSSKQLKINRTGVVHRDYTSDKTLDIVLRVDEGDVVVRGQGTKQTWDTCTIVEQGQQYRLNTDSHYTIAAITDAVVTEMCEMNTRKLTDDLLQKLKRKDLSDLLEE